MVDVTKLQFYSGYPIDKIVQQGTASYTVAGSVDITTPTRSLQTITNTYGVKGIVILSWSTDNTNFYDQSSPTRFISTFFGGAQGLSFQAQGGASDSTIYFYLQNGLSDGTGAAVSQTVSINFALVSTS